MKIVSAVESVKKRDNYLWIGKNVAVVKRTDKSTAIVNYKTGEIIVPYGHYMSPYNEEEFELRNGRLIRQITKTKDMLRVFDLDEDKLIIDNMLVKYYSYYACGVWVLQDLITGKYNLFSDLWYKGVNDLFPHDYDKITFLSQNELGNDLLFIIEDNGRKGIYSIQKGFITDMIYSDITRVGDAVIFKSIDSETNESVEKLSFVDNCSELSKEYKAIIPAKKDEKKDDYTRKDQTLYCINACNTTDVYGYFASWSNKRREWYLLCTLPTAEEVIELSRNCNYHYAYVFKKNGKYGLYLKDEMATPTLFMLPAVYDKIERAGDVEFYLYKDGKKGCLSTLGFKIKLVEPKYDEFFHIPGSLKYYLFKENGTYKIAANPDFTDPNNPEFLYTIVTFEELISCTGGITFKRNGKVCLFKISDTSYNVYYDLDDVEIIDEDTFITTKGDKKSLWCKGKCLIHDLKGTIELKKYHSVAYDREGLYIVTKEKTLREKEGMIITSYDTSCYKYIGNQLYQCNNDNELDVKLFTNVIVKKSPNGKHIYIKDYDDETLATFGPNISIQEIPTSKDDTYDSLYSINGTLYFFQKTSSRNIFGRVPTERLYLYMKAYECEFGTVVVNSLNENEFDETSAILDKMPEEEFETTLKEHFEGSPKLQEQYPTLTLKLDK